MLLDVGEPSSYHKAIFVHDHARWKKDMQNELDSIHKNETQDLVPLPKRQENTTMYKYKYRFDSALRKYKAHIVTKNFKPKQGIDFDEIFSPVLQMTM